MDKAVKDLHNQPPAAKTGKASSVPDDEQLDSLRAQLEKAEAHAKKLEDKLAATGRQQHCVKASKDSDTERPFTPKKTDNPKAPAQSPSLDSVASV